MFEASGVVCYSCGGSGFVKSPEYSAMNILRGLASQLLSSRGKFGKFTAIYLQDGALVHIMNFKRKLISLLEKRYNTKFIFYIDNNLKNEGFRVEFNYSTGFGVEEGVYSKNILKSSEEVVEEKKPSKSFFAKLFGK